MMHIKLCEAQTGPGSPQFVFVTATAECAESQNGKIKIFIDENKIPLNKGWSLPFEYRYENIDLGEVGSGMCSGGTTEIINLKKGTYKVFVDLDPRCMVTDSVVVMEEPNTLEITLDPEKTKSCNYDKIIANVSGGSPDYRYTWTKKVLIQHPGYPNQSWHKMETKQIIDTMESYIFNLIPNKYCIQISDSKACLAFNCLEITNDSFEIKIKDFINISNCDSKNLDASNGLIDIELNPISNSPYAWKSVNQCMFNWTGPNGYTSIGHNISSLAPGTYNVTVTNKSGCTANLSQKLCCCTEDHQRMVSDPNSCFTEGSCCSHYLDELRKELFKPDSGQALLYTFIHIVPPVHSSNGEEYQIIDSTKMIRAAQPDPYKAIDWIRKIAFTRNPKCIDELQEIYDKHILNFMDEWSQIFLNNYYMCESIKSRFQVLAAFEQALTSLSFSKRKLKPKQIFEYAFNHLMEIEQLRSKNVMKDYVYYSKYMYSLNPNNYPYDFVIKPFNSIDPYFEELKPEFVAFLINSKWLEYNQEFYVSNWKDVNPANREFNKYYLDYYYRINSPEIKEYIRKNIELGIRNVPHFIFWYGLKIQDYDFNSFIIDHLLASRDTTYKYSGSNKENYLALLTRNDPNNIPLVLNSLLKMSVKDPEAAIKNSKYLPWDIFDDYTRQSIETISKMRDRRQKSQK